MVAKLKTEASGRACARCRTFKPWGDFGKFKRGPNGRRNECLKCSRIARKKYNSTYRMDGSYLGKQSKRLKARRARGDLNWPSERSHAKRYNAKYPEKSKAKRRVRSALESGLLIRPAACSACGEAPSPRPDGRSGLHAHHHCGYDKPLDVQWLCVRCHSAQHSRARKP